MLLMLVAGYGVPQIFYRRTSGRWLVPMVPLVRALALAMKPVTAVFLFFYSLMDIADEKQGTEEAATPAENIEALIEAGTEEGLIHEEDRKLIQSVVEFGDKVVREVMTPRPNIVAIPVDATLEELRQIVINEQYSRIPVYEGTIDQIIGFVHVRDMFELEVEERVRRTVRELMRPIRFVPESKPVNDLMREMQQDNTHMVIVVDEYGNTAGLCTMEDLVEVIVGEIRDEHEPGSDVTQEEAARTLGAGRWRVFRRITVPQIAPGLAAGALFAFMVSFDNFPISMWLSDAEHNPIPLLIFQRIASVFEPSVAAMSTLMILFAMAVVLAVERLAGLRRALAM